MARRIHQEQFMATGDEGFQQDGEDSQQLSNGGIENSIDIQEEESRTFLNNDDIEVDAKGVPIWLINDIRAIAYKRRDDSLEAFIRTHDPHGLKIMQQEDKKIKNQMTGNANQNNKELNRMMKAGNLSARFGDVPKPMDAYDNWTNEKAEKGSKVDFIGTAIARTLDEIKIMKKKPKSVARKNEVRVALQLVKEQRKARQASRKYEMATATFQQAKLLQDSVDSSSLDREDRSISMPVALRGIEVEELALEGLSLMEQSLQQISFEEGESISNTGTGTGSLATGVVNESMGGISAEVKIIRERNLKCALTWMFCCQYLSRVKSIREQYRIFLNCQVTLITSCVRGFIGRRKFSLLKKPIEMPLKFIVVFRQRRKRKAMKIVSWILQSKRSSFTSPFRYAVRQYLAGVRLIQKYLRGFVVVHKARLELLHLMWEKREWMYRVVCDEKRKQHEAKMKEALLRRLRSGKELDINSHWDQLNFQVDQFMSQIDITQHKMYKLNESIEEDDLNRKLGLQHPESATVALNSLINKKLITKKSTESPVVGKQQQQQQQPPVGKKPTAPSSGAPRDRPAPPGARKEVQKSPGEVNLILDERINEKTKLELIYKYVAIKRKIHMRHLDEKNEALRAKYNRGVLDNDHARDFLLNCTEAVNQEIIRVQLNAGALSEHLIASIKRSTFRIITDSTLGRSWRSVIEEEVRKDIAAKKEIRLKQSQERGTGIPSSRQNTAASKTSRGRPRRDTSTGHGHTIANTSISDDQGDRNGVSSSSNATQKPNPTKPTSRPKPSGNRPPSHRRVRVTLYDDSNDD